MILGLDHTGLAVRDLEAARGSFAALGFTRRAAPQRLSPP
jgi:catechol 2,3-dioxygenase-like lactoylglutathione lyase family enzyme